MRTEAARDDPDRAIYGRAENSTGAVSRITCTDTLWHQWLKSGTRAATRLAGDLSIE